MPSRLAERIRSLTQEEAHKLSLAERVNLIESLLADSVAILISTRAFNRTEALQQIARSHKAGRRPSVLNNE